MKKTAWLLLFAIVLTVAAFVLAGCGGGGGASPGGSTIEVILQDYKFTPNPINATKGAVTFKLTNKAAQLHDFSIPDLKVNIPVEAGKTVTQTVTLDQAGTFQVICNQPAHKDSGMTAQIIVK